MQGQSTRELISKRIAELRDWRGETLSRMRKLIKEADPDVVEEWKWMGTPIWSHDGIICTGESYKKGFRREQVRHRGGGGVVPPERTEVEDGDSVSWWRMAERVGFLQYNHEISRNIRIFVASQTPPTFCRLPLVTAAVFLCSPVFSHFPRAMSLKMSLAADIFRAFSSDEDSGLGAW
jgi:hypothetical protein